MEDFGVVEGETARISYGALTGKPLLVIPIEDDSLQAAQQIVDEVSTMQFNKQSAKIQVIVGKVPEVKTVSQIPYFWALVKQMAKVINLKPMEVYIELLRQNGEVELIAAVPEAVEEVTKDYRYVEEVNTINDGGIDKVILRCWKGISKYKKAELRNLTAKVVLECTDLDIPTDPELYKRSIKHRDYETANK